jgi:hypothetical protein
MKMMCIGSSWACGARFAVRLGSVVRFGATLFLVLAVSLSAACQDLRSVLYGLAGKSEGKLVVNVGMTLAEVQSRSTLKLAPSVHYPSGEELTAGGAI